MGKNLAQKCLAGMPWFLNSAKFVQIFNARSCTILSLVAFKLVSQARPFPRSADHFQYAARKGSGLRDYI